MSLIHVTQADFEQIVEKSTKPALVDFWASWCGPCKMIAPILEEIDTENPDAFTICKVNVEEQPQLAARFGVMMIPTLVFFKDGAQTDKLVGMQDKSAILDALN